MAEYLSPGVFIEEIERGPKPIEGVATSTAAFLGETARGPVKPTLVTSYSDYLRLYGNVFTEGKFMPYGIKAFFDNGGQRCYITRIVGANSEHATVDIGDYSISARGPGLSGNRFWIRLSDSTTQVNGEPVGFHIEVFYWDKLPDGVDAFDPVENPDQTPRPSLSENFDDLRTDPSHPDYYDKRVNHGNSSLIELTVVDNAAAPGGTTSEALTGGTDGDEITAADFAGEAANADDRRGLAALDLDPFRDVAIVYAPDATPDVINLVIAHCKRNRFRFAVVDSAANIANAATLDPRNDNDSQYAAFYYPWVVTSDPLTGQRLKIPPGGAVCGVYARSDNTRGVFKAPANEVVLGALDLEFDIDRRTQDVLNPRGVNVIRRFPGRGIRVWGARTLSSDPLWKYVSVRRLFIFIEASIFNSTQWVVFEPNDQQLWARVKQTVTLFLRGQWQDGALFGEKEEEAFTVNVGRQTMTQDDILNGRLIVEIGIAPVRPAEFVIFRLFQKTQEANN